LAGPCAIANFSFGIGALEIDRMCWEMKLTNLWDLHNEGNKVFHDVGLKLNRFFKLYAVVKL